MNTKEKWIETEKMKRLTMDNVEEMGMYSLAHNCCYIDENRNTRYRDFEIDIDARELAKGLLKEMTEDAVSFESDEDFDDWMGCCIGEDGISTPRGLIATFYQNLWAMAELREKLKYYEDLEEQGRLLVLPCKVGDTVYGSSGGRCQSDKWISVDDVMPAEKNSIFAKLKGTDKWNSVMWEKTSGEVIVCIEFEDGTRKTTVAKTHDGSWKLDMPILKQKVTHWMPLPELPKEER